MQENLDSPASLESWYFSRRLSYEQLGEQVRIILSGLLNGAEIPFLSINSRAKSMESFLKKVELKDYDHPKTQMTDLAGVRVITYIESDVAHVCGIVRSSFDVDEEKSLDKSEELEADRFGYRSIHFVCSLGKHGEQPELSVFKEMVFEVQVRTVLQHAWAEIDHDRSYKFAGILPRQYKRRLSLIAGMLEIADREFNSLARDLDQYAVDVQSKAAKGELNIAISTASVRRYMSERAKFISEITIKSTDVSDEVIEELGQSNIDTLAELQELLNADFLENIGARRDAIGSSALLRLALLYDDIDRYFQNVRDRKWTSVAHDTFELLSKRFGKGKVERVLREHGIHVRSSMRT